MSERQELAHILKEARTTMVSHFTAAPGIMETKFTPLLLRPHFEYGCLPFMSTRGGHKGKCKLLRTYEYEYELLAASPRLRRIGRSKRPDESCEAGTN